MKNMKLSTKLIGGFVIVALIGAIIGAWGILKIKEVSDRDSFLFAQMTVPLGQLAHISTDFQRIRVNSRDMIDAQEPDQIKHYAGRIEELSPKRAGFCTDVFWNPARSTGAIWPA